MENLSLYQELEKLLRMESRYCSEDGVLLKNSIVESALALRPDLDSDAADTREVEKQLFLGGGRLVDIRQGAVSEVCDEQTLSARLLYEFQK